MVRSTLCIAVLSLITLIACQKASESASGLSLSTSASVASIGEQVAVTLSSNANASRWTVTPATASKTYSITTSKVNYFTFNQPGVYTVSVSAKTLAYDSTRNQSLDSCWNHTARRRKNCTLGVDSASVKITVTR